MVLKIATNADTTVENAYTVKISLKVWDSGEKLVFSSRLPLRCHIAQVGTFSVDPGIVVSFYASAHHPYTTLAIDEWTIIWPSEDSPVEVGSTECSQHLVFESSLHVRLLQATLQYVVQKYFTSPKSQSTFIFQNQGTPATKIWDNVFFFLHFLLTHHPTASHIIIYWYSHDSNSISWIIVDQHAHTDICWCSLHDGQLRSRGCGFEVTVLSNCHVSQHKHRQATLVSCPAKTPCLELFFYPI